MPPLILLSTICENGEITKSDVFNDSWHTKFREWIKYAFVISFIKRYL